MSKIRTSSMHSYLHPRVQALLDDEQLDFTFRPRGEKSHPIKCKDTGVTGMFQCGNKKCAKKWSSKRIAIVIRLFRDNKYTVVVYHQRCERCDSLALPTLDETYEERVSRWLKIWSGINVPRVHHERKETRPHQRSRCEGCKAGHCKLADE
ncbi:hypothetical protein G3M48_003722 [Beauveria asiatica]|uniref:3CxxC-type domain-containing protein n=1 Tax=Beauveria asiatica TaxID=1069075 RepID=A0AAW0RV18_9HYPO